jgi:hypothetical protein
MPDVVQLKNSRHALMLESTSAYPMNFDNAMAQNGEPCCDHIKMINKNSQLRMGDTWKMQSYLDTFFSLLL